MHATIPKGNMGYDQHATLFLTLWLSNLLLLLSFSIRKHTSMASRAILSNFFEEQKLDSLQKLGINMYFCTEPLITTTFIGQPTVIACPQ